MKCDVLLVTALVNEHRPIVELLREQAEVLPRYQGRHFKYDVFKVHDLRVAVPLFTDMGQLNSAVGACRMLEDLSPKFILLLGIAGCLYEPDKGIRLGDVAVSQHIIDY